MPKRKESGTSSREILTPSKRSKRQLAPHEDEESTREVGDVSSPSKSKQEVLSNSEATPSKSSRLHHQSIEVADRLNGFVESNEEEESGNEDEDTTPRPNGTTLFTTPRSQRNTYKTTPSRSIKINRSAKRRSVQTLITAQEEQEADWDNSAALAQAILDETENIERSTPKRQQQQPERLTEDVEELSIGSASAPVTPSKRSRGRPKGAKNKRSPTPEGDLPPEERYFFQNRTGPTQVSANSFSQLGLLSHDEYFENVRSLRTNYEAERANLTKLHTRAFPQWKFELEQGFSVCMYGYGSKRRLVNTFAEWLYPRLGADKRIVILNGHPARLNIRSVLSTIGNTLVGPYEEMRLVGQPHDMVDTMLSYLTDHVKGRLVIMVNSIDSSTLRKASTQSVLARLAAHPKIGLVASADTPTFPVLWSSILRNQFQFVFHDCTTFAPYDVEINPVDEVHELLGRKNRRMGGKEGVGFVLKSLPENARNLYRILLTEILTIVNDGVEDVVEDDEIGDQEARHGKKSHGKSAEDVGIEYKALYQKASEEFICSSDMNFRFLLKEFHDHQMITSRRDGSGTELLGVLLQRDEMEGVLEDLVIG